jgi:hypothetical protein
MSGMEPIIMGAVAGAALNRDDPMKGAMMGAALGGGAGALLGGAGAAGAAEAGALGAAEAGALGGAEGAISLARPDVAPVLSDYITQAQAAGQVPMAGYQVQPIIQSPMFDYDAIARASLGSDITGIGSGASGSSMYSPFGGMIGYEEAAGKELAKAQAKDIMMRGGMPSLGGAMNMLRQAQPRAAMQAPGIRRGQPQAVNYGGLASLLEPKLVERRRLSLL